MERTGTSPSEPARIDAALLALEARATSFARMRPREKARLAREVAASCAAEGSSLVASACALRGVDTASAPAGVEWLAGPVPLVRYARELAASLDRIDAGRRPRIGRARRREDGLLEVAIDPLRGAESFAFGGMRASVLFREDVRRRAQVEAAQAAFYAPRDPLGAIALVLGVSTSASAAALDALHALFVTGQVALVALLPEAQPFGPALARALAPLVRDGLVELVDVDADGARDLARRDAIASITVSGTRASVGALLDADAAAGASTALGKPLRAAAAGPSPFIVLPYLYANDDLDRVARELASQIVHGPAFDDLAPRVLVTGGAWPQREAFLRRVAARLAAATRPPRDDEATRAVLDALAHRRDGAAGEAPGTAYRGASASPARSATLSEPPELPRGVLVEAMVESAGLLEFLPAAVALCNDVVAGGLAATLVVPPGIEHEREMSAAIDDATRALHHGVVGVNRWPALAYALGVPPWGPWRAPEPEPGAHSGAFVHDAKMLGRVDKTIVRGPFRGLRLPAHFDGPHLGARGVALSRLAARPGAAAALGVVRASLRA